MTVAYEGVTFLSDACLKMSKTDFVKAHVGVFWQDRDEKVRKKMLAEAYDIMTPKTEKEDE